MTPDAEREALQRIIRELPSPPRVPDPFDPREEGAIESQPVLSYSTEARSIMDLKEYLPVLCGSLHRHAVGLQVATFVHGANGILHRRDVLLACLDARQQPP